MNFDLIGLHVVQQKPLNKLFDCMREIHKNFRLILYNDSANACFKLKILFVI